ncbi:MAG: PLP-dependent aminotransferase family protein [Vicinamibacterales bacterium]|jgi:DNA-binding transcriptional MocR family regulator|nr:PLP-dependent aminotransferase family protein [Vicinamibacterales bacterium]
MVNSALGSTISIDRADRQAGPVYRQIADAVVAQVESGALARGSRLPTVRRLAESLGVTRVTAHKAYAELKTRGWVDSTVGRGTFVSVQPPSREPRTPALGAVSIDRAMAALHGFRDFEEMVSLAVAEPDPALCPGQAFLQLCQGLASDAAQLFEYGTAQGEFALRVELSKLVAERGIAAGPDDILVTSGATQGLSLVTTALCKPGDRVVVEESTYLGILGLLKSSDVEPVGVPLDAEGPRLDRLQRIFARERPPFFYTIPTFQNPTGQTMSAERRSKLLWLAADYGVTIVEDDIYRAMAYDEADRLPDPLIAQAQGQAQDHDQGVVYIDSFSKVLLPGVRVGYLVAPPALRDRLVALQQVREICGPPLLQRALAEFLRRGLFKAHVDRVLPIYRARRDALVDALAKSMPDGVTWSEPSGGYCSWVTLPAHPALADLLQGALARGVAYSPGEVFQVEPEPGRHLRLCFGTLTEEQIRQAVETLGDLINERLRTVPGATERVAERRTMV